MFAVGIDLGGTSIKAALVRRDTGIVHEASRLTEAERGPEHVLDVVAALVREVSDSVGLEGIEGVGVGAPGSLNLDRTTVSYPPNLPGWGVVDVAEALHTRLGRKLPVIVENDANVAGLGSAFYGAGRPFPSFLMATLGTGVGGAIIFNKRIFRGMYGAAGELGHVTIDYAGPADNAGVRGAIEAYIGGAFFDDRAQQMLADHPESLLFELLGPDLDGLTPRHLHEAAQAGDEPSRAILAWAGHKLGVVLGSAINLLDIRKVIVGGGVSAAGDYILQPARETVGQYVLTGLREGIEILQETLGNEAATLGAAHLIFEAADDTTDRLVV